VRLGRCCRVLGRALVPVLVPCAYKFVLVCNFPLAMGWAGGMWGGGMWAGGFPH
jgi:hypothetical protein